MDPLAQRELEMLAQAKTFFLNLWNQTNNSFISYKWQEIIFSLKVASVIISLLLLLAIIILLIKINIISRFRKSLSQSSKITPSFSKERIEKKWEKINKRLKSGPEANYKLAVLEADRIFDRAIKEIGYGIEKKLTNIDEIRQTDKIKSSIIEDKKFKISKEETERTVAVYRRGLEELGVL